MFMCWHYKHAHYRLHVHALVQVHFLQLLSLVTQDSVHRLRCILTVVNLLSLVAFMRCRLSPHIILSSLIIFTSHKHYYWHYKKIKERKTKKKLKKGKQNGESQPGVRLPLVKKKENKNYNKNYMHMLYLIMSLLCLS